MDITSKIEYDDLCKKVLFDANLNDEKLLDMISKLELGAEFYYQQELIRVQRLKSIAACKDVNEYGELQEKLYFLKSLTPQEWLKNWIIYKSKIFEARKRQLL